MNPASPVLAIDPSSRCCGYALLAGLEPGELLDAGRIVPSESTAGLRPTLPALAAWLERPELLAYRRIVSMLGDLAELVHEHRPAWVLVEMPSGRAGTGSRAGAKSSLSIYGAAAGVIFEALRHEADPDRVLPVSERIWTAGQGDKGRRQQAIAGFYPQYDAGRDPGGDVSDAVGLARWWLALNETCIRAAAPPAAAALA